MIWEWFVRIWMREHVSSMILFVCACVFVCVCSGQWANPSSALFGISVLSRWRGGSGEECDFCLSHISFLIMQKHPETAQRYHRKIWEGLSFRYAQTSTKWRNTAASSEPTWSAAVEGKTDMCCTIGWQRGTQVNKSSGRQKSLNGKFN